MTMNDDGLTPEDVSRLWPVTTPVRLRQIAIGTNNRSFIVDSDDRTYYLKRYDNVPNSERSAFEHRLTAAIAALRPSFAVPETILSRTGETNVREDGRSYALSTFIPGAVARTGDRDDASASGRALAELHVVLAHVSPIPGHDDPRDLGDLGAVHPLVPDPKAAIRDVLGDDELIEKVNAILSSVQLRCEDLTSGWPLTVIHGDFYPSNVLMRSHRVTGIVDFEFAAAGYRAMDVAIGVYAFAFGHPDMGTLIERFTSGYLDRIALRREEIEAIPAMILLREVTSLIHWTGRFRQELTDRKDIEERARRLVDLARFMDGNGTELITQLRGISSRRC